LRDTRDLLEKVGLKVIILLKKILFNFIFSNLPKQQRLRISKDKKLAVVWVEFSTLG
jgi:hypothetical protein